MKILHITNNYPTEKYPIFGIFVKEQIESLNKLNINSEVFFINGRERGKLEYFKSIWRIRKKLKRESYDIVHCHHALSVLCLILSGRSKRNKGIVSFQNDPIHEYGKVIFKFIKKHTQGRIFKNNSSLIKDEFSFYLPNGVNTNFFKPINKIEARKLLNIKLDTTYVLFVSSNFVRKQKRYDRFTKTLRILKEKYKYNNIEEIKLTNTNRSEIPLYFNAIDVHLLSSDFEGSPNSVKESMACNTAVVSTNVGNVFELLENVQGSYVAETNSAESLAKMVDIALRSKKYNGREELIRLQLDIESVAVKLMNIYSKILKK